MTFLAAVHGSIYIKIITITIIIIIIVYGVHLTRIKEGRNAFKILTVKNIGKETLRRPRRRRQDNIRMVLQEIALKQGIGLLRLRIGNT